MFVSSHLGQMWAFDCFKGMALLDCFNIFLSFIYRNLCDPICESSCVWVVLPHDHVHPNITISLIHLYGGTSLRPLGPFE